MEEQSINSNSETVQSQIPNDGAADVVVEGFVDLERDNNTTEASKENEADPISGVTKKTSKKVTSEAWDHFDKIVEKGVTKAKCKYCKAVLSYKVSTGTSHLLKHAKKVCSGKHLRIGVGQTQLKVKTEADGCTILELKEKEKPANFDQDVSRKELISMIVIHEYPLSMVDHIGFRKFVKSLNPSFKMISRNTLKADIVKKYNEERSSLKHLFENNDSRVAITTDMWTASNQKKGYMAVTSHFIDQQWVLHNRTLRFCFVPSPHTAPILAKVLMDCLSHYSLENKISSVVLDNATTNDAMMSILKDNLDKLIVEYQKRNEGNNSEDQLRKKRINDNCGSDEDEFAQAKRTKKRKVNVRGEVEHYLDDDPLPDNDNFDILDWWKRDQTYPTLQKIVKDVLAIPVSSVASESAFSTGGRVVSSHRSRLHSQTVEALMCLQNWMVDDIKGKLEDTHSYSIVTEDCDEDGDQIDYIDMDVDDVESSCNMEDIFEDYRN